MFFFQYLSCICSLVACITQIEGLEEAADIVREISQIIWCSVSIPSLLYEAWSAHPVAVSQRDPAAARIPVYWKQCWHSQLLNKVRQKLRDAGLLLPPQVCACMLTQHKAQLDARDKNPGMVRPAPNPYAVSTPTLVTILGWLLSI